MGSEKPIGDPRIVKRSSCHFPKHSERESHSQSAQRRQWKRGINSIDSMASPTPELRVRTERITSDVKMVHF